MKPLQLNSFGSIWLNTVRDVVMLATVLVTVLSGDLVTAGEIQYRIKAGIQDRYVNKAGLVAYDAPVMVNEVVVTKNNFYGGLWNATSLGSEKYGKFGKELDFNFGYKQSLGSGQFWIPTCDIALSYYVLGDWTTVSDDRFIIDFRIEFAKIPIVQPYIAFRYFGSVGEASKDGEFFWLGLRRDQSLGIKPFGSEVSLRVDAFFAFVTQGSMGRDGGFIYSRVQTSLNVPLSKRFSINPFCMVQVPAGDQNGGREDFTKCTERVLGGFVGVRF